MKEQFVPTEEQRRKAKKICFSQHNGCTNCPLADHPNKRCVIDWDNIMVEDKEDEKNNRN